MCKRPSPMNNVRYMIVTSLGLGCLLLAAATGTAAQDSEANPFVRPEANHPAARPLWGHRSGLQIGLSPSPGPRGLIRIYTPYLGQRYPRVVNFVSIEPAVDGQSGRGQSELEQSRWEPEKRGLTFWADNRRDANQPPEKLAPGILSPDESVLKLFIHTEPFANGAVPVIECQFHRDRPHEVMFRLHASAASASMARCTLSATMGNFGQLRQIHLADKTVHARDLWKDQDTLDQLGFLSWRSWDAQHLKRKEGLGFHVELSTDSPRPASETYASGTPYHWKYVGRPARHYWRTTSDTDPSVAVNGRRTYWMSDSPIPGGVAFENFELVIPYQDGQALWFGVVPDDQAPGTSSLEPRNSRTP